jgi:hypothetical protein
MYGIALFLLSLISDIYLSSATERLNISNQFFGSVARYCAHCARFRFITKQPTSTPPEKMFGMDYAVLRNTMRTVFESDLADDEKTEEENLQEGRTLEKDEFTQLCRLMMFALDKDNLEKNRELMKEAKKKKVERLPNESDADFKKRKKLEQTADVTVETGDISMDEYVRACGSNEVVRMSHLTKFFDKDRKKKIGLLSSDKQRSLMECIFDDTVIEAPKKNEGLKKGKSGMLEAMFMNA